MFHEQPFLTSEVGYKRRFRPCRRYDRYGATGDTPET